MRKFINFSLTLTNVARQAIFGFGTHVTLEIYSLHFVLQAFRGHVDKTYSFARIFSLNAST